MINDKAIMYEKNKNYYIDVDTSVFRKTFNHLTKEFVKENQHNQTIIINTCEMFKNWYYQSTNPKISIYSSMPLQMADNEIIFNRYSFWSFFQKTIKRLKKDIKIIGHENLSSKDIVRYLSDIYIGERFISLSTSKTCLFCDSNYIFPNIELPDFMRQNLELQCKKVNI